jgi:hypothetical protein
VTVDTYLALIDAIQNHVQFLSGERKIARDWVLALGIHNIDHMSNEQQRVEIRVERSPHMAIYTTTGLLNWALDCYHVDDLSTDPDEN